MIFCWRKLFFTSVVAWYAGTHESTIFIMYTHWNATNDFIMDENFCILFIFFNKRLYEYYSQRLVRFVDFLAKSSDQMYFFNEPSLYVYYLLLVVSLFFKIYIFLQVLQIFYFTRCILWYLDFV